jgi:hypothetical protein
MGNFGKRFRRLEVGRECVGGRIGVSETGQKLVDQTPAPCSHYVMV